MIKVMFVRLYEKEQRADVAVEDSKGRKRMVCLRWLTKDRTPIPENWLQQVEAELNYQDSEEQAKASGRSLIR